jgi:hypothetical protein
LAWLGVSNVADLINKLTGKRTDDCPTLALAPLSGSAFLQVLLDLIPDIATDDCRMLPFVDYLFVPMRPA